MVQLTMNIKMRRWQIVSMKSSENETTLNLPPRWSHSGFARASDVGHPLGSACQLRQLFIFECDFQRCVKPRGEFSHVILPICFLGKIATIAPTRTEII